jgi:hypothetical protein
VQVEGPNDSVYEHVTQASVQEAIWSNIHYKWFYLGEEAPICNKKLCGEFSYNAISPTARAILAGTYDYPKDFDKATKELCQECAIIRQTIPKDSINIQITKENHHARWQRAKEETSSSYSGLHFSHYMAGALLDYINHFHALKATLLLHHGLVWNAGHKGYWLCSKKCWLLYHHQTPLHSTYGGKLQQSKQANIWMLSNAWKCNLMPEEICSKRNRMADDGILTKVLTYNIIWQMQCPASIALVWMPITAMIE